MLVVVDELMAVGAVVVVGVRMTEAQAFESQSGLGKIQVRVRVFREVFLLLELAVVVDILVLGVQMRPDEPSNI